MFLIFSLNQSLIPILIKIIPRIPTIKAGVKAMEIKYNVNLLFNEFIFLFLNLEKIGYKIVNNE